MDRTIASTTGAIAGVRRAVLVELALRAGHDPCYYDLGALTDRTSSAIWTNRTL